MMWWVFDTRVAAEAAEAVIAAGLGPDVIPGTDTPAPVQITQCWAQVRETADGRWAFPAKPGEAAPDGAQESETVTFPEAEEA